MCYRIPIFVGAETLDTVWCRYVPLALVIHHGPSFNEGHYTTLMPEGEGLFSVLDDDRAKRRATPVELAHASCTHISCCSSHTVTRIHSTWNLKP